MAVAVALQEYAAYEHSSGWPSKSDRLPSAIFVRQWVDEELGHVAPHEILNLSVKTVETHCAHLKEKLVARNTRELVRHAVTWAEREGRLGEK